MLLLDSPAHTRVRSLVNKAFTPRLIELLRPRIASLTGDLVDALAKVRAAPELIPAVRGEHRSAAPANLLCGPTARRGEHRSAAYAS